MSMFQPPEQQSRKPGDPPPPPKPKPKRMDPKLESMLTHFGMPQWVPLLEAEIPEAVKDIEIFKEVGRSSMKEVFHEIRDSLFDEREYEDKLPEKNVDAFIQALFPTEKEKRKLAEAEEAAREADAAKRAAAAAAAPAPEAPDSSGIPASQRYTWEQDTTEVRICLRGLAPGTKAKDVKLKALAKSVSLSVNGEVVLDAAQLYLPVISADADFDLQDAPGRASRVLTVMLPKVNQHPTAEPWAELLRPDQKLQG
jgi:hypothetical protein